jgi:DNA polymerase-3 subunit delta
MSVAAQRALRLAIQNGKPEPVYYLHGDDDFRKAEAVETIVSSLLEPATREFNLDVLRGPELDAERLSATLAQFPAFAPARVVIVRDVTEMKKPAREVLARYLQSPARETTLVLVSAAGAKPDESILSRATSVPFPPLTGDAVPAWLTRHAAGTGVELPEDCARLIADAVGGDLALAVGELDKLASYAGNRAVTASDVSAILGVRAGETPGDLLDAVAARDAARALRLVEPVLSQPKTNGVQLVMMLATQMLAISWACAARARGLPAARLEAEFMNMLRGSGAYVGRPWMEAAKSWARNVGRWQLADANRALRTLQQADVALKDTRVSSDEAVVTSVVLSLCAPAERRRIA